MSINFYSRTGIISTTTCIQQPAVLEHIFIYSVYYYDIYSRQTYTHRGTRCYDVLLLLLLSMVFAQRRGCCWLSLGDAWHRQPPPPRPEPLSHLFHCCWTIPDGRGPFVETNVVPRVYIYYCCCCMYTEKMPPVGREQRARSQARVVVVAVSVCLSGCRLCRQERAPKNVRSSLFFLFSGLLTGETTNYCSQYLPAGGGCCWRGCGQPSAFNCFGHSVN